jgi:4-hydroxy-3-methylbut-2-enyl diphosphate reductase
VNVKIARDAGVCYGVERALKLAHEASTTNESVHTLGPLIHNPQAVQVLREHGVEVANALEEINDGTVVIRSHGVDPAIIDQAVRRGLDVIDATCPFVSAAHKRAHDLAEQGYSVVIVGEEEHPEVEGILAHAGERAIVVQSASDIPDPLEHKRVGVVVQTTQPPARLEEVVDALLPLVSELRVFNTICDATAKRQAAAAELAAEVDVMIVIGGHNSGNTTRLAQISRSVNERTHHVETSRELDASWFVGASTVGVTAGASTPDRQMAEVVSAIETIA